MKEVKTDAIEMFLARHERLHSHVGRLLDGLTEDEVREPAHPRINPIAWLLWHIARSEDSAVSLLICEVPQLLDDEWAARLNVEHRGVGAGMNAEQVMTVSANVNLEALMAYWKALEARTRHALQSLDVRALDEQVGPDRVHRAVAAMQTGPAVAHLEALFQNTGKGQFLVWLPLAHVCEHVGQVDLVRGILGHPGPV